MESTKAVVVTPRTANRDIYDSVIDRAAMLRLFEQKLQGKVVLELNGHEVRMNKLLERNLAAKKLFTEIDEELSKTYGDLTQITSRDLKELCVEQELASRSLLARVMGKTSDIRGPGERLAEEIVLKRPLINDLTLEEGWRSVARNERIGIEQTIRRLAAKGLEESDIASELSSKFKIAKIQASGLVRTAITSIKSQADHEVYSANEKILRGWQYVAVLDSRTTPVCAHRDGHIYPIGDISKLPPAHWHCRSTTVPVVKSFDALGQVDTLSGIRRRNLARLTPEQRKYYDGEAYSDESYQTWLMKQPYEVQLRHFGDPTKTELFLNGKLTVDKFVEGDRQLSLKDIRAKVDGDGLPNTTRFIDATLQLDSIKLNFARPDELIGDKTNINMLRKYYLLQSGALDGTLSLTNYRGQLIHVKRATKQRVLNILPTDKQLIFNPITKRYEDARIYRPNPSILTHRLDLVANSDLLKEDDKKFISEFIDGLGDRMGANERAVVTDNLRVVFERYRNNGAAWGNTKAVLNGQIKYDVMNISESLETSIRVDADPLKKLKQQAFLDPVLGPTQLQEIHDTFIDNIKARNDFETGGILGLEGLPLLASKIKFHVGVTGFTPVNPISGGKIPLKVWNRMSPEALDVFYTQVARRIAMADLPDRDALAVSIGRSLYESANYRGDRNSWREAGLGVIAPLQDAGMLKLETFGVQKRRMRSRMTGEYFGQYYDTFSETVRVLDESVLDYAELNRRIDLGLRVGFTGEPTLIVRPGFKTYFTAKGNIDTRIPITSDSSFGEFPPEAITEDMAEALNWSANTKYKIDTDTYDGINRLLYFVDDRGKSKYYEDLNHFRKYIVARGDSYERFKAMEWHRNTNTSVSNMPFLDHRGRIYDRGLIGPQSGETFRPFLASDRELPLGAEGFAVLEDQIGSFFGGLSSSFEGRFNSLTVSGRVGVARSIRPDMVKIGNAFLRGKPNDIRYILESDFLQEIDGEDYAKAVRLSIEAAKIDNYLKGDYTKLSKLGDYRTALVLEQDASSSGAQIIALTTKNKQLATICNVVPTDQKQRLYDEIAARTFADPRFKTLNEKLKLSERDLRKAAKAQNMVILYGAGVRTGTLNVERKLAKILGADSNTLVVSTGDRDKVLSEISARMARYQKYDPETYSELARLRKDVKDIFSKGQSPGDEIMEALYFLDPETRGIVEKMTRAYDMTVTPDDFALIAKIMSENLAEQAPILRDFTKYFGRLSETFLLKADPEKSNIDFKYEIMRRLFGQAVVKKPEQKFFDISAVRSLQKKLTIAGYKPDFSPDETELAKSRLITSKFLKEIIQRVPGWNPQGVLNSFLFGVEKADLSKRWTHSPWVNFDGVTMEQYFTQAFEERISYQTADGEWVTNILMVDQKTAPSVLEELTNASNKMQDISDLAKAKTAYAVNGNHSNDAVLVKRFHSWGKRNNVPTSTIHDAFFTHISDIPRAKEALKLEYSRVADTQNVKATLDEMLRRGLPKEDYDKALEEAIELGIIPVAGRSKIGGRIISESDILKGSDILEALPVGGNRSWYAVGG